MEFKNSFYSIAVEIAKKNAKTTAGQLVLIDNFTMNTPFLSAMPFEKASHDRTHNYSRLMDASSLQAVDLDDTLPTMRAEAQLESVNLTPFGGKFEFGEDRMKHTHHTPESFLATLVPPVLRKSGMNFEKSLFVHNFVNTTIKYQTARAALSKDKTAAAGNQYPVMVAVTWEPGEMTGLYSPLPYGQGNSFGKLFETEWLNGKQRHTLPNGVTGYAATVKTLLGILLANKQKISSLVNIVGVPTPTQLAALVNAANATGSTRIYCAPALKTSIAAAYAYHMQSNGLVSVTSAGEVSVLGVPIVASNNIPTVDFIANVPGLDP